MSIVDLHAGELLHELMVDLQLFLLELGNGLLAQINCDDVNQDS